MFVALKISRTITTPALRSYVDECFTADVLSWMHFSLSHYIVYLADHIIIITLYRTASGRLVYYPARQCCSFFEARNGSESNRHLWSVSDWVENLFCVDYRVHDCIYRLTAVRNLEPA